jgi:hypothetical protein
MSGFSPPSLVPVFHLAVEVAAPLEIGDIGWGERRVIDIKGGTVSGPDASGRILPGGADYQIIRPGGLTELRAHYVIELDGGHLVYVENLGLRFGAPEALARIRRGEPVDPSDIYFRCTPRFETGSSAWAWLMTHIFVGVGIRKPDRVEIDVYKVA